MSAANQNHTEYGIYMGEMGWEAPAPSAENVAIPRGKRSGERDDTRGTVTQVGPATVAAASLMLLTIFGFVSML